MNQDQVEVLVQANLKALAENMKSLVQQRLVAPFLQERLCGSNAWGKVWIIALIPEHNVCFGYSESGHEESHLKWGLLFSNNVEMGDSGAWYPEFSDLIEDCGYF